MRFRTIATATVLLMLCSTLPADTLSVPVGVTAYMAGQLRGETRGRLLMRVPIPEEVQQGRIDFALLLIPGFQLPDSEMVVTLRAHEVTTAWNPGDVNWEQPWHRAGGDFDTTDFSSYTLSSARNERIGLDVTRCVKRWRNGTANHGLILTRPRYEGHGFALEAGNLRQAIGSARVKYYYSHVAR